MIRRTLAGAFVLFMSAGLHAIAAVEDQPRKTVLDGVYTAAQAERGHVVYAAQCAHCHGDNLDGIGAGPMLYSSRFLDRWREDALRTLYDYIAKNMPLDGRPAPGNLTPAQYLDVTAYLLSQNEIPAGDAELTAATLDSTLLVGPSGPQPLPPSTTVRVVGCIAQAGGAWTLTKAGTPARALKGDTTDAAELAKSAQTAPGTLTFRLPNLADDHSAAELTTASTKRVQVKGVLNGDGATARISVLSFQPLDQACQ